MKRNDQNHVFEKKNYTVAFKFKRKRNKERKKEKKERKKEREGRREREGGRKGRSKGGRKRKEIKEKRKTFYYGGFFLIIEKSARILTIQFDLWLLE